MKPKKAFINLTLARIDVLTIVDALKGYAQLQVRDGHPNDAVISRHVAETISEALK